MKKEKGTINSFTIDDYADPAGHIKTVMISAKPFGTPHETQNKLRDLFVEMIPQDLNLKNVIDIGGSPDRFDLIAAVNASGNDFSGRSGTFNLNKDKYELLFKKQKQDLLFYFIQV